MFGFLPPPASEDYTVVARYSHGHLVPSFRGPLRPKRGPTEACRKFDTSEDGLHWYPQFATSAPYRSRLITTLQICYKSPRERGFSCSMIRQPFPTRQNTMQEFRPQAPSAETVFYRTYSRRKQKTAPVRTSRRQ